jgi:hypothetical protein
LNEKLCPRITSPDLIECVDAVYKLQGISRSLINEKNISFDQCLKNMFKLNVSDAEITQMKHLAKRFSTLKAFIVEETQEEGVLEVKRLAELN